MKKSSLISILLLMSLLASCGSGEVPNDSDSSVNDSTEQDHETTSMITSEERLGDFNFGGAVFNILGREYAKLGTLPSYEFATDSENGDLINDTIYKRNRIVEEQYNVKIVAAQAPQGQGASFVEKSQMAGDGEYDLVWAHINDMSTMVQKGLLADYNSIQHIDITQPWWNQLATESLTINGKCYLQMNYIPFTGTMLSHCLYFNKNLAEVNKIDDIYSLVLDDKWTFDNFAAMVKQVSNDVDGNGVYDDNDLYGLLCSHGTSGGAFSVAMDTKPISINNDGSFKLTMVSDRNQSILEKIVSLTSDTSTYLITDYKLENDLAIMFSEGKSLFYSGFMTDSYQFFRDMKDDFGLLPFPKFDESQENYITTPTGGTGLLGIPKYVKNPEMVGVITEALAIESYNYVYPAIYETVFTEKLLRDDESKLMFDILMNGLEIDFGRTFKHTAYADLITSLTASGSTDLASSAAAVEAQANKHYEDIISIFFEKE
ncbi:MAG: extracellular solute-binding protein [Clostridiales bacterium]|nr:extracellular solute-binding protein [Clostridiales bacterium]